MARRMTWWDVRRGGMLFSAFVAPVTLSFVGQRLDVKIEPKKKRRYCRKLWK